MDTGSKDYSVIGKRLPRLDGPAKANGAALYAPDIILPGMLYAKLLRSPCPHANIRGIDTTKATKLPGVKALITGKDVPRVVVGSVRPKADFMVEKYALAVDKVRFMGDEVAAVAAIDEEIAQHALALIQVDYQELPAVFDPEEAMSPEAPRIHNNAGNARWEIHLDVGDVEKGFQESYYVREDRFRTQTVTHCPLETHNCVAAFDATGKLTIWTSSQAPSRVRAYLSRILGIEPSQVRVVTLALGGGFGSRDCVYSYEVCAVFLARETGKPVKLVFNREETFTATRVRHALIIDMKTGVEKDGTLKARQVKIISDNGAYSSLGPIGLYYNVAFLNLPLKVPNIKCDAYQVYTNNPSAGAMRGYGAPQPHFACNCHLDMIARDLGLDTSEVMARNAVQPGDKLANEFQITSCGLTEAIQKAAKQTGFSKKQGKMGVSRGIGLGCYSYVCGSNRDPTLNYAAVVKVHEDGGISLLTGAADLGQGSSTVLAMIVAEEFGVHLSDIRVVPQDTEVTPLSPGTFSSRVTFWDGNAVKAAAADAKAQLFKVIAEKLEANPNDLVARDRRIYVKGSPDKGMSVGETVLAYQFANQSRPIIGTGFFSRPPNPQDIRTGKGNPGEAYSFGATIAEVEVNCQTGQVKLLKLTMAHDCGFALNPMAVEGQLEGAAAMGAGYALSELLQRDEGRIVNPSFLDYKVVLSPDVPQVETIIVESIDPLGPFGAKEAGEGPIVAVAPAIANAIYDAVGVRITELPITPEKVLRGLEEKKHG